MMDAVALENLIDHYYNDLLAKSVLVHIGNYESQYENVSTSMLFNVIKGQIAFGNVDAVIYPRLDFIHL